MSSRCAMTSASASTSGVSSLRTDVGRQRPADQHAGEEEPAGSGAGPRQDADGVSAGCPHRTLLPLYRSVADDRNLPGAGHGPGAAARASTVMPVTSRDS